MDKVLEKAEEIRQEILLLPEVQEFLKLKEIMENNEELQGLRSELARLANENKIAERDNLLAIYNTHPLVVNYNHAKEEVMSILNVIKDIIK